VLRTKHLFVLRSRYLRGACQAVALVDADQHDEAILRVRELAITCPKADALACQIMEMSAC
jgi:hypothetical protein